MDILIGHTGFVGANLLAQHPFDRVFNSRNIDEIAGQSCDSVVCSAVQAKKWWANQNPVEDWELIERLLKSIERVEARKFILISTVDVFSSPTGCVESDADVEDPLLQPYGKHRLLMEKWVTEHFNDVLIVRLPALFGDGLKKNIIYDLIHDNQVDQINPHSSFQWYPLSRLWMDIMTMQRANIACAQLVTEPVGTSVIVDRFFPARRIAADGAAVGYDLHTTYAAAFGGKRHYIMSADEVLQGLAIWLDHTTT